LGNVFEPNLPGLARGAVAMTKEFKAVEKEGYIINVTVLSCDMAGEEIEQREKRLSELIVTATLRKWKRKEQKTPPRIG
jgi:hypothetical protein